MHRTLPRRTHLGLMAALILALAPQLGRAQNSEEVRFETADKVKIKGTFYPSGGGNKSPCVILLHKLGGSRKQDGWDVLAAALQNKGFAVLSFDFRGHNDSTAVDADVFYTAPVNKRVFQHGKETKDRDRISYKDFVGHKKNSFYTPMLVNDIEAAKNFLDQKNNAQACNASNVIIVGAEDGAALGALWLTCQFKKPHFVPVGDGVGGIVDPRGRTEGDYVASAVWLSIPSYLTKQYPVGNWLGSPARDRVPMMLVYGDKDDPAAKAAKYLAGSIKSSLRGAESAKIVAKKGSKAAGAELLKSSLGTSDEISDYLAKIMDKRGNAVWEKRVIPLTLTLLPLKYVGISLP